MFWSSEGSGKHTGQLTLICGRGNRVLGSPQLVVDNRPDLQTLGLLVLLLKTPTVHTLSARPDSPACMPPLGPLGRHLPLAHWQVRAGSRVCTAFSFTMTLVTSLASFFGDLSVGGSRSALGLAENSDMVSSVLSADALECTDASDAVRHGDFSKSSE